MTRKIVGSIVMVFISIWYIVLMITNMQMFAEHTKRLGGIIVLFIFAPLMSGWFSFPFGKEHWHGRSLSGIRGFFYMVLALFIGYVGSLLVAIAIDAAYS
jgi:hypothetical protein